jgi:probable phosphoglycerate mutase
LFNVPESDRSVDQDNLTPQGQAQAERLGKEWSSVRIDHLYSSSLKRAAQTAEKISEFNVDHPTVERREELEEQYWGKVALEYYKDRNDTMVRETLWPRPYDRKYRPGGDGESMEDLCVRAHAFVENDILGRFGVCLPEISKAIRDVSTGWCDDPKILPDGIPHVVVVSHNTFMNELHEELMFWNKSHDPTSYSWHNAHW